MCDHRRRTITGIRRGKYRAKAVTRACPICGLTDEIPWHLTNEPERAEAAQKELTTIDLDEFRKVGAV